MSENLAKLLNYIPGYRSRNKRKMIIAGIYYFIMLNEGISGGNPGVCIAGLMLPCAIVSVYEAIKNKSFKKLLPAIAFFVISGIVSPTFPADIKSNDVSVFKNGDDTVVMSGSEVQSDAVYGRDKNKDDIVLSDVSFEISSDAILESSSDGNGRINSDADYEIEPDSNEEETKNWDKKTKQEESAEQEQAEKNAQTESRTYEQSPVKSEPNSHTVYIGKTGSKYHRATCHTLRGNATAISLDEARSQGRQACKVCGG